MFHGQRSFPVSRMNSREKAGGVRQGVWTGMPAGREEGAAMTCKYKVPPTLPMESCCWLRVPRADYMVRGFSREKRAFFFDEK